MENITTAPGNGGLPSIDPEFLPIIVKAAAKAARKSTWSASDIEDVAQDTAIILVAKYGGYPPQELKRIAFTISQRLAFKLGRKSLREISLESILPWIESATAYTALEDEFNYLVSRDIDLLSEYLDSSDDKATQVVQLLLAGRSVEETAEQLNIKPEQVYVQKSRFISRFQRYRSKSRTATPSSH